MTELAQVMQSFSNRLETLEHLSSGFDVFAEIRVLYAYLKAHNQGNWTLEENVPDHGVSIQREGSTVLPASNCINGTGIIRACALRRAHDLCGHCDHRPKDFKSITNRV